MKIKQMRRMRQALASAIFTIFIFCMSLAPVTAAYVSLTVTSQLSPSTIEPGDSGNLILTVANGGTTYARNVKLIIKSHSFITFGQTTYNLQTIAPSGSMQVSVPITVLPTATEGSTTIFFTISYSEGDTVGTITIDTSTSVSLSKRSLIGIENVTYDKALIEPGDVVEMSIGIKNVGSGKVKDLVVALENYTQPFVSATGDMEVFLGDVPEDGEATATFSIIINKEAKTIAYSIPATIKYYDELGTRHTETKYIGLKVSGMPDFVVTLEDDSGVYRGRVGELTISVANRGTATASFLTLSFDSKLAVTPSEYYVGNLDPDDYETITLSVNTRGVVIGKRTLNLQLLYKDPYNQEFSDSASVSFTVQPTPPIKIPPAMQVVIFLIIAGVSYWKRKALIRIASKFFREKNKK